VSIIDNGSGLPPGFNAETTDRLGLQIVRTLVSAELGGTIDIHQRVDGQSGTEARLNLPVAKRPGSSD
jgi:two-component sensor histidine kinase